MHVHGAGAAVIGVVTPHLREQLGAGEDASGVLSHELEQFKLFEGQVQRGTGKVRGVRLGVNNEVARAHDALFGVLFFCTGVALDGEAQARIHFGGGRLVRNNIVNLPGGGNRRHTAFVQERDERQLYVGGAQQLGALACLYECGAGVDHEQVESLGFEGGVGGVEREDVYLVAE